MRNDCFDLKMRNLKLDTYRCFLPADSFQNVIEFHQIKQFCLYLALYFIPLPFKTLKSLVIRHVIPHSFVPQSFLLHS